MSLNMELTNYSHHKIKILFLLTFLLISVYSGNSLSKTQSVQIQSDSAKFEQSTGEASYQGHVVLSQEQQQLFADSLVVYKDKNGNLTKIIAHGQPAKFKGHLSEDLEPVHAQAHSITFFPETSILKLNGKAKINYKNDVFNGPILEYHLKNDLIIANKQENERPSIILETPNLKP